MGKFPFLMVLGTMCMYTFPFFFAFIVSCKIFNKRSSAFLEKLRKLTNIKIFQNILFATGCLIGIFLGLKYGYTDSLLNNILACLAGLLAGAIITGIAYTIMNRLSDYLKEDQ